MHANGASSRESSRLGTGGSGAMDSRLAAGEVRGSGSSLAEARLREGREGCLREGSGGAEDADWRAVWPLGPAHVNSTIGGMS